MRTRTTPGHAKLVKRYLILKDHLEACNKTLSALKLSVAKYERNKFLSVCRIFAIRFAN